MSKLKYLIDGKADEQFENMLWCFGGGDPESDDSGSTGGSGDSAFYDNERPGLPSQNRPVGGTTNVVQGTSQPRDDGGSNSTEALTNIVTMGLPAPAIPNAPVSFREEVAMNQLIDDMDMERRMTPPPFQPDPAVLADFQADLANEIAASNARLGRPVFINVTDGQAIPPLGDPYDELPPSPAEIFRAQESQRAMGLDQRQAGYDAYQAMLNDAVGAAQSNIDNASGLLGGATKFMNQKFIDGMNTRIGDRDSEAYQSYLNDPNLFSPVYNAGGRLTGYRDEFGRLTGTDPLNQSFGNDDDDNDVVPPVANPMTGTNQCPDGYTFDEDLQACRRMTKRELRADGGTDADSSTASNDLYFRRGSLDDAPANLPSGFNFADANRRFTQSYAFRPSFYRNPMDTTGFTKLL